MDKGSLTNNQTDTERDPISAILCVPCVCVRSILKENKNQIYTQRISPAYSFRHSFNVSLLMMICFS